MSNKQSVTDIQYLKAFLEEGERCGVDLPKGLMEKLARLDHDDGLLRVVLVGGFSVGKTSIAAAWLGKPREDMKISSAESSSAVTVYEVEGNVQLVDTPGLFGFKEQGADDGEVQTYRDMTRKYVSEAGLLLYVLDPGNPLKESHKEELHWLFRDLNLLPRTVFVLSQFDKIADLEDEDDFAEHLAIKQENVRDALERYVGLTAEEEEQLSIVAVAANPFDNGVDHWTQPDNAEEFQELSHIGALREATDQMLVHSGGAEEVREQTALSIVRDVAQRQMVPAVQEARKLLEQSQRALRKAGQEGVKLERLRREANESRMALARWVEDYFKDLKVQVDQVGREDFAEFFERNLGQGGQTLQRHIQLTFERETQTVLGQLESMTIAFRDSGGEWDWLGSVGKRAKDLGSSGIISGSSILAARNALGVGIKFKPWGAIGLASKLNIGLAAAGPIIEGVMFLKKYYDEQKFEEQKKEIKDALQEQWDDLRDMLDSPDFMQQFFPQFAQMEEAFAAIRQAGEEVQRNFHEVCKWAEIGRELCQKYGIEPPALPDESDIIDV